MQPNSDKRIVRRWYSYHPRGRYWAVYHNTAYVRDVNGSKMEFSTGEKVGEYTFKEDARKEVYRLNG